MLFRSFKLKKYRITGQYQNGKTFEVTEAGYNAQQAFRRTLRKEKDIDDLSMRAFLI